MMMMIVLAAFIL